MRIDSAARRLARLAVLTVSIGVPAGVLVASPVAAQAPSVRDGALRDWTSQRDTLVKIAAALPQEKFGFRPTPAQRTWGEQILHIAQANVNQMGRLGGKAPAPAIDMTLTSPAAILTALTASFDYGTAVLEEQTEATMIQAAGTTRFDGGMGPSTRVRVVYYVIGHTWDIYGQMVVYLRLNGITPPASQRF
jgi:uncharacterized damage-inducible protein DinB